MLLAGDVGGTKTLIGLFAREMPRPRLLESRSYPTNDHPSLSALTRQFLADTTTDAGDIEAAAFGVAGPVEGTRARLTNVPWVVDIDVLRRELPIRGARLLNDLEALAWSIPVLAPDELVMLHEGTRDPDGNVGLIAAGTGLGVALLASVGGRLVPHASEGGHADFAARNELEYTLASALAKEFGRVDVERVVSGPGIANIHRLLNPHQCAALTPLPEPDDLPPAISRAALEDRCDRCRRTLEVFVSAYAAAAGNLALTVLATGGVYLGGGIAPRMLDALRWPVFMQSFLDKAPMEVIVSRVPVNVIVNPGAGLLGAACATLTM
jgi:glucokinase